MIIRNYHELCRNLARKQVLDIVEAGIAAVEPRQMLSSLLTYNEDFNSVKVFNQPYDLMRGRIFVIGGGKASGAMAEALEKIIGSAHISGGVLACKERSYHVESIKMMRSGHPYPDFRSVWASRQIFRLKEKYDIGERDLVICLISGGASSMLAMPAGRVSLGDKQKTTKLLLESGASITEINIIRKHLSGIKGGQLAEHFAPARVLTLVISDVIDNRLEVIGSGPTVPDTSTFSEALAVLDRYGLLGRIPERARKHLEAGARGDIPETPKAVPNADNFIIGSNQSSLESMAHKAVSLGLRPIILGDDLRGDPNVMAYKMVRNIMRGEFADYDVLLLAGETNPKLPEKYGRGGRNQQFAAASMLALRHLKQDWTMASVSTDGIDYDLRVAGALVDRQSLLDAEKKGLDVSSYVRTYNTYRLFKKMGASHIRTGHTGTNVADIVVYRI